MLFPDLDNWDLAESRHPAYRESEDQIMALAEKLHGNTKFYFLSRYRLADQLFIAALQGLIASTEILQGWGLLGCPLEHLNDDLPIVRDDVIQLKTSAIGESAEPYVADTSLSSILIETYAALWQNALPQRRARLLRSISVAACSRIP